MVLTSPAVATAHPHRLRVGEARSRFGGAEHADLAEDRPQHQARQARADQLDHHVAGDAAPREIAACGERDAHRRVEVGAGTAPMNIMIAMTMSAGSGDRCTALDGPVTGRADHPTAGSHQHEQERAEQLREQPTPFEPRIVEIRAGAGHLQSQQASGDRRPLPARPGWLRCVAHDMEHCAVARTDPHPDRTSAEGDLSPNSGKRRGAQRVHLSS